MMMVVMMMMVLGAMMVMVWHLFDLRLQLLGGGGGDLQSGGGGGYGGGTQAGVRKGGLRADVVHPRGRGVHAGSSVLAANCRAMDERGETRHLDQLVKGGLVLKCQGFVHHWCPSTTSHSNTHSSSTGGALGTLDGGGLLSLGRIRAAGWWVVQGVEPPAGLPVRQPLGWRAMIVLRLRDEVVPIHIVVCRALRVLVEIIMGGNVSECKRSTDKKARNNLDCMSGQRVPRLVWTALITCSTFCHFLFNLKA